MDKQQKDASNTIIDQEAILEAKKKQRFSALTALIQRQTDYTEEQAIKKLEEWNNDYLKVIKEYLNPEFQNKKEKKKENVSKNQMIYGEIRDFMDDVNKQQLWRKRRKEALERKKTAYINYIEKMKQIQKK